MKNDTRFFIALSVFEIISMLYGASVVKPIVWWEPWVCGLITIGASVIVSMIHRQEVEKWESD